MNEENVVNNQYRLNRKLKILIADDKKRNVDEIISNLDVESEDYEIIGYALSNEEERRKIEELKPDIVITDIFRGILENKNAGGLEIIKEYSEKYYLPKFIVISYTPDFTANNIIERYPKLPSIDYEKIKRQHHCIKITENSSFIRGYEERKTIEKENNIQKSSFMKRLKILFQ